MPLINGTCDRVMTQRLVVPDRPVLRCASSQRLTVTKIHNTRLRPGVFSPQSARARPDQRFQCELPGFLFCGFSCFSFVLFRTGQNIVSLQAGWLVADPGSGDLSFDRLITR